MRFVFGLFSLVALGVGIVAAAMDAILSVASDRVVLTPFEMAWSDVAPQWLRWVEGLVEQARWPFVETAFAFLMEQPAAAVFLALSFLLYVIAYRPRRDGAARGRRFS